MLVFFFNNHITMTTLKINILIRSYLLSLNIGLESNLTFDFDPCRMTLHSCYVPKNSSRKFLQRREIYIPCRSYRPNKVEITKVYWINRQNREGFFSPFHWAFEIAVSFISLQLCHEFNPECMPQTWDQNK